MFIRQIENFLEDFYFEIYEVSWLVSKCSIFPRGVVRQYNTAQIFDDQPIQ